MSLGPSKMKWGFLMLNENVLNLLKAVLPTVPIAFWLCMIAARTGVWKSESSSKLRDNEEYRLP